MRHLKISCHVCILTRVDSTKPFDREIRATLQGNAARLGAIAAPYSGLGLAEFGDIFDYGTFGSIVKNIPPLTNIRAYCLQSGRAEQVPVQYEP